MKTLLLLTALFAVTTMAQAQKIYRYKRTTFDYFEKSRERRIRTNDIHMPGRIYISKSLIKIDWNYRRRQVYAIVSCSSFELADEGYFTKCLTLMAPTVKGVKMIQAVLLFDPQYRLSDVIIKNSDTVNTTYSIRD